MIKISLYSLSQKSIRKDILLLSYSRSVSVQSTFVCLFVFQFEKLKPRIF